MTLAEPKVHLAIGSRVENIELVQIAVEASLGQLEVDEEVSHFIGIAVREAVANAIRHGNKEDPEKRVEVEVGVENGEIVVLVTDEGRGFDLDRIPDPLAEENLLKPSGRGIFFMGRFMDTMEYDFDPNRGTVLTLRKKLAPAESDESQEE